MRADASPLLRLAFLQATLALLRTGVGRAALELHDTPVGPSGQDSTPIVSIELAEVAGTIAEGVLRLVVADASGGLILRSGAPTWARLVTAAGSWLLDLDVGLLGSDAAVQLPSLVLRAGGRCPLPSTAIG